MRQLQLVQTVNPFMALEGLYLREFVRQMAKGNDEFGVRAAFDCNLIHFDTDIALHERVRQLASYINKDIELDRWRLAPLLRAGVTASGFPARNHYRRAGLS